MSKGILRRLLIGSSALALIGVPALRAQDQAAQDLPLSFGLSQTFETVNNAGFNDPSSGNTATSITSLSFGSARSSPTESLRFSGGLGIAVARSADGSTDTSLDSPHLSLAYDRTTAASALTARASYSNDQLARLLTLQDFVNDQGQVVLPSNPADLVGTGLKQDITADVSLEIGRDAPFGLIFSLSGEQITYTDVTDPSLQDQNQASAGVTGRFSWSPQGDLTLGVSADNLQTQTTPEATQRNTQDLTLGTSYRISPVLGVSGSVRYETVDATGSDTTTDITALIGADYSFLNGSLSFNFGTGDETSDLIWRQTLLTGDISVELSHGLDDSGQGSLDQASFSYNQAINDVSGLSLGLFYSSTNGSTTSPDVAATTLMASYNHRITKDWGMNLGANYRLRDPSSDSADPASSAGLFLTLSRNVNFLH